MKYDASLSLAEEKSPERIASVLEKFSYVAPKLLSDPQTRTAYAEKIAAHGVCAVAYLYGAPVGFQTFYANDQITKRAYGSIFAVSPDIGLMRGIVWKEIFKYVLTYSRNQGMKTMMGEVSDDNENAAKQYRALGFRFHSRASETSAYIIGDIEQMLAVLK